MNSYLFGLAIFSWLIMAPNGLADDQVQRTLIVDGVHDAAVHFATIGTKVKTDASLDLQPVHIKLFQKDSASFKEYQFGRAPAWRTTTNTEVLASFKVKYPADSKRNQPVFVGKFQVPTGKGSGKAKEDPWKRPVDVEVAEAGYKEDSGIEPKKVNPPDFVFQDFKPKKAGAAPNYEAPIVMVPFSCPPAQGKTMADVDAALRAAIAEMAAKVSPKTMEGVSPAAFFNYESSSNINLSFLDSSNTVKPQKGQIPDEVINEDKQTYVKVRVPAVINDAKLTTSPAIYMPQWTEAEIDIEKVKKELKYTDKEKAQKKVDIFKEAGVIESDKEADIVKSKAWKDSANDLIARLQQLQADLSAKKNNKENANNTTLRAAMQIAIDDATKLIQLLRTGDPNKIKGFKAKNTRDEFKDYVNPFEWLISRYKQKKADADKKYEEWVAACEAKLWSKVPSPAAVAAWRELYTRLLVHERGHADIYQRAFIGPTQSAISAYNNQVFWGLAKARLRAYQLALQEWEKSKNATLNELSRIIQDNKTQQENYDILTNHGQKQSAYNNQQKDCTYQDDLSIFGGKTP